MEVIKKRQKATSNDVMVCLDSVDGLGDFVELERLIGVEEDDLAVQNELRNIMLGLGMDGKDRVLKGYDVLMWEKGRG